MVSKILVINCSNNFLLPNQQLQKQITTYYQWESKTKNHQKSQINGLVQKRHNSNANTLELQLSHTNSSNYWSPTIDAGLYLTWKRKQKQLVL